MNGDVTVREVMTREYVGASESDGLRETAALLLEEGRDAAVVLRGQEPVGVVTRRELLSFAVDNDGLSTGTVADVMQGLPSTLDPQQSLSEATDIMSANGTRHLLVVENGEPTGILTEHDVVTATMLEPSINGEGSEADAMTADPVATGEPAGDEEYSNQGICEVCGTLTRNLSSFNGQLVCSDCLDV